MIDRNIRNTRSKEETKKAHRRAVLTVIVLFILFQVVTRAQNLIAKPFNNAGVPILGSLLAMLVGIAIVGAAGYLVYKYAKSR